MKPRIRPTSIAAGILLLAACDNDVERPVPPPPAQFTVVPDTLVFDLPGDSLSGDWTVTKTFEISYDGVDSLYWYAVENLDWLSVTPDSGLISSEVDTLDVLVSFESIGDGQSRDGNIVVQAGEHSGTVRAIASNQVGPRLCVDADSIRLDETSNPGPVVVAVSNCGIAAGVDWTVSASEPWVILTPVSGTSAGEADSVEIAIDWRYNWAFDPGTDADVIFDAGIEQIVVKVAVEPNCRLEIERPSADMEWLAGHTTSIRWNGAGTGPYVVLQLYKGDQLVMDLEPAGLIPSKPSFVWTVTTAGLPSDTDYRFRIASSDDAGCEDWSDFFTIIVPNETCAITVTAPGRSVFHPWTWYEGNKHMIEWEPGIGSVRIDLYLNEVFLCNITEATANDGQYPWLVTRCGETLAWAYRIKITRTDNVTCTGFSGAFASW